MDSVSEEQHGEIDARILPRDFIAAIKLIRSACEVNIHEAKAIYL
jgi:hypothetical protein